MKATQVIIAVALYFALSFATYGDNVSEPGVYTPYETGYHR